jgi:hypothetical protein
MNNQTSNYRIPYVRPYRIRFLPRNPQQGVVSVIPNNGRALDSSMSPTQLRNAWNYTQRMRHIINWIKEIVKFIYSRIREKTAAGGNGCSTPCVAVGTVATAALVVVGSTLSVGLGAGIKYDGENMNSTSTGNYTYINV